MMKPSRYEERKLIFNLSALVRRGFSVGAMPVQFNASPELLKRYERIIYDRLGPPRGLDKNGNPDKRPWIRLDDAPAIPLVADRSLKGMTVCLITDKDIPGVAVDLGDLAVTKPREARQAVVDERVDKKEASGAMRKENGLLSGVKDRLKGIFK